MRFWKAGTIAALIIGPVAAIQFSGAEAHGQVIVDREVPVDIEPLDQAREVLRVLGGSRLGISIDDVDADTVKTKKLSGETGVLVTGVDTDSPAAKGGLKEGDVILEFDGERVRSTAQLRRMIQETPAGRKVAMSVSRDGQRLALTVEPESGNAFSTVFPRIDAVPVPRVDVTPRPPRAPRPPSPPRVFSTPRPDVLVPELELFRDGMVYSFSGRRLGVTTQTLTDQLAKHFGASNGVLVTNVSENSAASKAGLKAGDVITKVGGTTIDDSGDLTRAIGQAKGDVTIEIVRDRKTQTLKATIEESPARTFRRVI